jgi:hypothetical protein
MTNNIWQILKITYDLYVEKFKEHKFLNTLKQARNTDEACSVSKVP